MKQLRAGARVLVTMRLLLVAVLAVAALPAAADAATLSRTGGTLRYEAGRGERISAELTQTGGGAFVARRDKRLHRPLVPGAGCQRSRPREVRCAGQGVARVEISLRRARTTKFTLRDVRVAVAVVGSAGRNSVSVAGTPDFTYDGGPDRDDVSVDAPDGHATLRLGAGADFFTGQPRAIPGLGDPTPTFAVDGGAGRDALYGGPGADSLDGGTGSDTLVGDGGADTLTGGPGTDTAVFGHFSLDPSRADGPISVTLDGQRNDGTPGQDALVGPDVENATIGFWSPPAPRPPADVLVGNERPNLLIGPGTVRGLGGNDTLVSNNDDPAGGTTLDGGDGADRIDAHGTASVVCGAGTDVVFTNAAAPADCEYANVGLRVLRARPIGRRGIVRARIDCSDPRGCVLRRLGLKLHGHVAGAFTPRRPGIAIPFGVSRTVSAQIVPGIWKRHRHDRSLRVAITPFPPLTSIPSPAVTTGSYPRALTLRIKH